MRDRVTIYIYFYEGEPLTRNLLNSIEKSTTDVDYKIVLIDDGSPSGIGKKFLSEGYDVIINKKNEGIPYSINVALKHPDKIKLLSQNDIIVSDGWLSSLLEFWDKYPDFLYVSPFAFNDIDLKYEDFNLMAKKYSNEFKDLIFNQFWGGLWLCDNRIVEKNGYYDERFKYYADDCDWCMRLQMNKIPTASTGSSLIMHLTSRTTPRFCHELKNNLDILTKKWSEIKENNNICFENAIIENVPYINHPLFNSEEQSKFFHFGNSMKGKAWL